MGLVQKPYKTIVLSGWRGSALISSSCYLAQINEYNNSLAQIGASSWSFSGCQD